MFSAHPMLPRVSVLLELSEDPEPPLPPQPARPRRLTLASVPPLNFSMSLLVNLYFISFPSKSLRRVLVKDAHQAVFLGAILPRSRPRVTRSRIIARTTMPTPPTNAFPVSDRK